MKSSGLTPAELVPAEMTKEWVEVGKASASGDSYKQALALKPSRHTHRQTVVKT